MGLVVGPALFIKGMGDALRGGNWVDKSGIDVAGVDITRGGFGITSFAQPIYDALGETIVGLLNPVEVFKIGEEVGREAKKRALDRALDKGEITVGFEGRSGDRASWG